MSLYSPSSHTSLKRLFLILFMLGIGAAGAGLRQLAAAGVVSIDTLGDGMFWFIVGEFGFLLVSGLALVAYAIAGMVHSRSTLVVGICGIMGIALLAADFMHRVPCDPASPLAAVGCIVNGPAMSGGSGVAPADLASERGRKAVALIAFLAGIVGFVLAFREWRNARQSLRWPSVTGQMTASHIVAHPRKPGRGKQFSLNARYRYVVNGAQFAGRSVYFGADPSYAMSRDIVARFPVGLPVDVYHHPLHHDRCTLLPGPNRYTYSAFVIGAFFWLMSFMFWVGKLNG